MSNNTTTVQGGIGFTGLLTIVFIVLNLTKANTGYYSHDAMPLDDFALYQYYEKYGVKNDITT